MCVRLCFLAKTNIPKTENKRQSKQGKFGGPQVVTDNHTQKPTANLILISTSL